MFAYDMADGGKKMGVAKSQSSVARRGIKEMRSSEKWSDMISGTWLNEPFVREKIPLITVLQRGEVCTKGQIVTNARR